MMNTADFSNALCKAPVIAILRGLRTDETQTVPHALFLAGLRLFEVPLNTPGALEILSEAAKAEKDLHPGAGTVLTPEDVRRAADAGAEFIVSPHTDEAVIRETKRRGLVSVAGFFTVTEAFTAVRAGADFLKLFPAGAAGAEYAESIAAVLTKPMLAFGGVTRENAGAFRKICAGLGVGGGIYHPGRTPEEIRRRAQEFLAVPGVM